MKATDSINAKRSKIQNGLKEIFLACTVLVVTVSEVVGEEGPGASVENTRIAYQGAIGQRISDRSFESHGRHHDLRCYESHIRMKELCVIRPRTASRKCPFCDLGPHCPLRLYLNTYKVSEWRSQPLRFEEDKFKMGLGGIETCQLLCPLQVIKPSNIPLFHGPV